MIDKLLRVLKGRPPDPLPATPQGPRAAAILDQYIRSAPSPQHACLQGEVERFDAVIACGVIYHLRNPVKLIHNLSRVADQVYVWTHYFVRERVDAIAHMKGRFRESHAAEHAGFRHTLHRYEYGDFLDTNRFAGGSEDYSSWLARDDLLSALRHAGFTEITIGEEDLAHANGPCISLVARRQRIAPT